MRPEADKMTVFLSDGEAVVLRESEIRRSRGGGSCKTEGAESLLEKKEGEKGSRERKKTHVTARHSRKI